MKLECEKYLDIEDKKTEPTPEPEVDKDLDKDLIWATVGFCAIVVLNIVGWSCAVAAESAASWFFVSLLITMFLPPVGLALFFVFAPLISIFVALSG